MSDRAGSRTAPATGVPPSYSRLPDGFGVALDSRVRRGSGGRSLLGGSPIRLLKLSATAVRLLAGGPVLRVDDDTTAALARRLLDTGVGQPRPRPWAGPLEVTVVVPVRDRPEALDRLLVAVRRTAGEIPVVVVDDGSRDAGAVRRLCERHSATVIRHDLARGPAAARNAGLADASTERVAFLDSDSEPLAGWLDLLNRHFDDPMVAAAAPRIVASPVCSSGAPGWLGAYEAAVSSLDLGTREGQVRPHSGIPYVPGVALLVRRSAVGAGYDEGMRVAEDVDLVWRLAGAGWQIRYEPTALVTHEHPTTLLAWARRRVFYGTGAALLADRHGPAVAPIVLSPWSAAAWLFLLARRRGALGSAATLVLASARLGRRLTGVGARWPLAARLVILGSVSAGRQLASAVVRHFWPVSAILAATSRRARRWLALIAAVDAVVSWWPHRGEVPLAGFAVFRRLDDLCYGAGLWWGMLRARSFRALRPRIGPT